MNNKELVLKAMTELLVNKDITALDRYWGTPYIQHDPMSPNGTDAVRRLLQEPGLSFGYEPGMIVAEDTIVMVHGRYTGFGPEPIIAVDIFRVENGKIVEHWDVMQEEVTETASGNPMFTNPQR